MSKQLFLRRVILGSVLVFGFLTSLQSATTALKDPLAIHILDQSLDIAGGKSNFTQGASFSAVGDVKRLENGETISGTARLSGRGSDQIRVEIKGDGCERKIVLDGGLGILRQTPDCTVRQDDARVFGNFVLPYAVIAAALDDVESTITYLGESEISGRKAYKVFVRRRLPVKGTLIESKSQFVENIFFVDQIKMTILKIVDSAHPPSLESQSYSHEMEYHDYEFVSGRLVALRYLETYQDRPAFEIRLRSVDFNVDLPSTEFLPD